MTKVKKVAGIDISKEFFDVCLMVEAKQMVNRFTNDQQGMQEVEKWLAQDVYCIMEATGPYYLRLAIHLHKRGFVLSVINPLVIRRFCQMRLIRAKTDKADARMIALYGISEEPPLWAPPEHYCITLQHLDAISTQLSKQHTALSNQLEAFSSSGMLQKQIKQFLTKALNVIEKQQLFIEAQINTLIEEHYSKIMQQLISIPGLGKKTAMVLLVITQGFTKFSSAKQLSAHIGLTPRIYQSGSSIKGKARICKMGMSRVRALLYLCAWSAKRYNKACKELYERLLAKGKAKKLALIAVANKLLKQAFAIANNQVEYNDNYVKNICL